MFGRKARRIKELDRQLMRALGIITEKNDALANLGSVAANLNDRNERLSLDLKAMRERLPRVADDRTAGIKLTGEGWSAVWNGGPDPDPTRPYIPTYDEDEQLIDFDPDAARPYIRPVREVEG